MIAKGKSISHGTAALEYDLAKEINGEAAATEIHRHELFGCTGEDMVQEMKPYFVDFEMQTPEGKTVKLSDYVGKGKVVLVDFWASWCGPCRREMPNLVETYAKYKGKNFEIVGVSLDQDGAAWKEAIKKLDMTWPQMSDLKFWQSEGAQLYAVNSIPHTVLIDGSGKIIARGLHGEELQAKIAEAVK